MRLRKENYRELLWWLYFIFLFMLTLVVPNLMSAPDTIAVIVGILLMVAFGVVSWKFWVRRTIQFIWGKINEK